MERGRATGDRDDIGEPVAIDVAGARAHLELARGEGSELRGPEDELRGRARRQHEAQATRGQDGADDAHVHSSGDERSVTAISGCEQG
jgi:hypothetical protein